MDKFDQNLSVVLTFVIIILGIVGKALNEAISFDSSVIFGALLVLVGKEYQKDHVTSRQRTK
jgi:hypothetical protein